MTLYVIASGYRRIPPRLMSSNDRVRECSLFVNALEVPPHNHSFVVNDFCRPQRPHIFAGAICASVALGEYRSVSHLQRLVSRSPSHDVSQLVRLYEQVFQVVPCRECPGKSGLMNPSRDKVCLVLSLDAQSFMPASYASNVGVGSLVDMPTNPHDVRFAPITDIRRRIRAGICPTVYEFTP